MAQSLLTPKRRPVMVRLGEVEDAAIREQATREKESASVVLRRIIRRGLELERREHDGHEAA